MGGVAASEGSVGRARGLLCAPQPMLFFLEYKYLSGCHVFRILLGLLAKIKCSICSY